MHNYFSKLLNLFFTLWLIISPTVMAESDKEMVVRAVLFYSPTCPHCHAVIKDHLQPMIKKYGNLIQIVGVNVAEAAGSQFYRLTIEHYKIPKDRWGVPTMIVGDKILVGGSEIPEQFPEIVEAALAADGIDWPDIPGLFEYVAKVKKTDKPVEEASSTAEVVAEPVEESQAPSVEPSPNSQLPSPPAEKNAVPTLDQNIHPISIDKPEPSPDPVGMALAWIVIVSLIVSLGYTIRRISINRAFLLQSTQNAPVPQVQSWLVFILALLGLGIAAYMAYVATNQMDAVCGPIGDCNIVQSSVYAQIMGIPISVLGVLNYTTVIVLWIIWKFGSGRLAKLSILGLLGLTLFGVLFSIYLTGLELFVILAVCMWCIASAIITILLMFVVLLVATKQPA
jgi:uncharacterized membrane protein/thiol-disulfide isomerase/thioredoxin